MSIILVRCALLHIKMCTKLAWFCWLYGMNCFYRDR